MNHPALAMLEITGIARGMVVCDSLVKRAIVEVFRSHPVDPGKYLIVFGGSVGDVEEAMEAAEESAGEAQLDQMFLPRAHDAVFSALSGGHERPAIESLGIVETHTLAGAVLGLDRALKIADVQVVELRLSAGLAGKGYFVVTGSLHDVEAGVEAAIEAIGSEAVYEIIASPHPDFVRGAL